MRTLTKSPTSRCTLEHDTAFLLAEAQSAGCVRLAEVSGGEFAHDAANRFLNREEFSPKDLCEEMRALIVLEKGILSVDDTVLDQPHSQEGKTDLVGYFRSGLSFLHLACTLLWLRRMSIQTSTFSKSNGTTGGGPRVP